MPSIIDVSRELLRRTRVPTQHPEPGQNRVALPVTAELQERVRVLEDNEQRQAELSTRMAQQLSQLTLAVTDLHRQVRWLLIAVAITGVMTVTALVMLALR